MTGTDVVREIYEGYGRGDLDHALAQCADDFTFRWALDTGRLPFRGPQVGIEACRARLIGLAQLYDYHAITPLAIFGTAEQVVAQVELDVTHVASGHRLKIEVAQFWTIRGGKAVAMVEYCDSWSAGVGRTAIA